MFKIALAIFIICVSRLAYSGVYHPQVYMWEWSVTIGSAGLLLRSWFAKAARDEMIESMYSKYDGPDRGKQPEYHGL